MNTQSKIEEVHGLLANALPEAVLASTKPLVLRGLVSGWPAVQCARRSSEDLVSYLGSFYQGKPVSTFVGAPEINGRFFYNDDLSGFNFHQVDSDLNQVLAKLVEVRETSRPPSLYIGSTAVDGWLPGFRTQNDIEVHAGSDIGTQTGSIIGTHTDDDMGTRTGSEIDRRTGGSIETENSSVIDRRASSNVENHTNRAMDRRDGGDIGAHMSKALVSIWIGNRSRVAAHFDFPDNLACCVAGSRRFTLFPPDALPNLYVGPLDLTPAGQQISLVDFAAPDFDAHPKFATALQSAQVAELAAGDALFIPGMWWHHVEALDTLNVLVNYWMTRTPDFLGSPADALTHAIMAIKNLSAEQRQAWLEQFNYYVFDDEPNRFDHIPETAKGRLGDVNERTARGLRAELLNRLNR